MYCPTCHEPMIVLEYEGFEVDYCAACRGVWLDAGEIDLLYGSAEACRRFLDAGGPSNPRRPRRCPQCRRRMEERLTAGTPPVAFDRCPRHGLWFDRGELAAVLAHGHPDDPQNCVVQFLRAVFPAESTPPTQKGGQTCC